MGNISNVQKIRVIPDQVNVGKPKQDKNDITYWTPGIKIDGVWYNGYFRTEPILNEGEEIEIETFIDEYQGETYNKWRLPRVDHSGAIQVLMNDAKARGKEMAIMQKDIEDLQNVVREMSAGATNLPF